MIRSSDAGLVVSAWGARAFLICLEWCLTVCLCVGRRREARRYRISSAATGSKVFCWHGGVEVSLRTGERATRTLQDSHAHTCKYTHITLSLSLFLIYVYIYIYIYIYIYMCMYVCMYICMSCKCFACLAQGLRFFLPASGIRYGSGARTIRYGSGARTIVVWNNLLQLLLCFCLATQILLKHVCEEKTARDS